VDEYRRLVLLEDIIKDMHRTNEIRPPSEWLAPQPSPRAWRPELPVRLPHVLVVVTGLILGMIAWWGH
jgi:hypothetical protein